MYNRIFRSFVSITVKLYSNTVVQSLQYKCVFGQFKFSVPKYTILTRGCYTNKTWILNQQFKEKCEQELNELLKDPEKAQLLDKLKLEVEYNRSRDRVPEKLEPQHWLHLLKSEGKSQRRSYLAFLWINEMKHKNKLKKKEQAKESGSEALEKQIRKSMSYDTMFHRIRDSTMIQFYNTKLMYAMLYSLPIVFDFGFEKYMTQNELQLCAKQLLLAYSANRISDDPANLYFCNVDPNSIIMQHLHRTLVSLYEPDFPINITSKSYLEIFDKSRLVYLTPHTRNVLKHYDDNAIYIIGAIVDKTYHGPLSFEKAKREGIKMAKFPLSEKLSWGMGSVKNLPLNHVLNIMVDLKATNSWDKALSHVPRRKLRDSRLNSLVKNVYKREHIIKSLLNE